MGPIKNKAPNRFPTNSEVGSAVRVEFVTAQSTSDWCRSTQVIFCYWKFQSQDNHKSISVSFQVAEETKKPVPKVSVDISFSFDVPSKNGFPRKSAAAKKNVPDVTSEVKTPCLCGTPAVCQTFVPRLCGIPACVAFLNFVF